MFISKITGEYRLTGEAVDDLFDGVGPARPDFQFECHADAA
jgi:hypothetical protein